MRQSSREARVLGIASRVIGAAVGLSVIWLLLSSLERSVSVAVPCILGLLLVLLSRYCLALGDAFLKGDRADVAKGYRSLCLLASFIVWGVLLGKMFQARPAYNETWNPGKGEEALYFFAPLLAAVVVYFTLKRITFWFLCPPDPPPDASASKESVAGSQANGSEPSE